MNGNEVFRFATQIVPKATEQVVQRAGWQLNDLILLFRIRPIVVSSLQPSSD